MHLTSTFSSVFALKRLIFLWWAFFRWIIVWWAFFFSLLGELLLFLSSFSSSSWWAFSGELFVHTPSPLRDNFFFFNYLTSFILHTPPLIFILTLPSITTNSLTSQSYIIHSYSHSFIHSLPLYYFTCILVKCIRYRYSFLPSFNPSIYIPLFISCSCEYFYRV